MALTIEDGTGVSGANSYVTLAEVRAYAFDRGFSLPGVDATLEVLVIKAADYIETRGPYFKGTKTYGEGHMQWPRTGVNLEGEDLVSTTIPSILKKAQCQAAIDYQIGDPFEVFVGSVVKREKVDVLETEYAINYKEGHRAVKFPKVLAILTPLCKSFILTVERA